MEDTVKIESQTKVCSVCKAEKPLDEFGSAGAGKYRQSHCRMCNKERSQKHRKNNRSALANYDAKRRKRDQRPIFLERDKIRLWQINGGICLCCAQSIAITD